MRFFNTAGPVNCKDHYCLPILERFDLSEIVFLIEQKKYFVLHAPRQTGKTSCLLALMEYLNQGDKYRCLYANLETGQAAREDVRQGMRAVLQEISSRARDFLDDRFIEKRWQDVLNQAGEFAALNEILSLWTKDNAKPVVLLLDEVDTLVGDTLISLLRQLRAGYDKRPATFPQSIILCGVRDIRDYRIHSDREKAIIAGGSAFNIKAKSLRLGNFDQAEVENLYQQHTKDTGQTFEDDAINLVWNLTQGQPWLVNALGYEACFEMEEGRDRSTPIIAEVVMEAKDRIIQRRETHLDQLVDKLREERVKRVIEPMLVGKSFEDDFRQDDVLYVVDLGLVKQDLDGKLFLANRIYQEIIPRELAWDAQTGIFQETVWYLKQDGILDMDKLMTAFQQFFRQHSDSWLEKFQYKEAGPQLLLQAFLQRIVNSGGRVDREYGLGKMRIDILVTWPHEAGFQQIVIELKLLYGSLPDTLTKGLEQTWKYMDRCGTEEGHLVIFDRDISKDWEEKIFRRGEEYRGKNIKLWGM